MIIRDNKRFEPISNVKFPKLKGEVKVTLHNCRTGKNEIIKGENIITNAVGDLFALNWLGEVDFNKLMPIWSNWFGGVLCYENAFAVDQQTGKPYPDDYFIQGVNVNDCVAHAGGTSISAEHDEDLLRGSPTTSAFRYTENSVKQVWEWLPSHGNSGKNISAIALTHKDTGDAGIGSPYWIFSQFTPFVDIKTSNLENKTGTEPANADNILVQYDDSHGLWFHEGESSNTDFRSTTNKLTVYIRKLPYLKAGLYETQHADSTYEITFTVTLSFNLYSNPCYWFDYENKKLWIFSNMTGTGSSSASTINYAIIDCESHAVDSEGTIVSDDDDLMAIPIARTDSYGRKYIYNPNIVRDGNYFYFPTSEGPSWGGYYDMYPNLTGYKKINITNQADQTFLPFDDLHQKYDFSVKAGGLIITNGQVFNGSMGYPCATLFPNLNYQTVRSVSSPDKISSYFVPLYINGERHILANKMVNTSKFNLPSPVQKTSSQSMMIEYTLTEVSSNE